MESYGGFLFELSFGRHKKKPCYYGSLREVSGGEEEWEERSALKANYW